MHKAFRSAAAVATGFVLIAGAVPAALAAHQATPKLVGKAAAGKSVFVSTCAACHTLKAAGATGPIGPNLDKTPLAESVIIAAITNGGATVMSKAAVAKYAVPMSAYKGSFSTAVIQNVAAYVYTSTHK